MKPETVSIVIPANNVEKYIERCLESVQQQTYRYLDIIVVLNGSFDNTKNICEKLQAKDKRVRILAIDTANVSEARNLGIDSARSNYIMFIDADDFIHKALVQRLYKAIKKSGADIVTANFEKHNVDALGRENDASYGNSTLLGSAYARNILFGVSGYDGYIWGKMYRTKALSSIRFNVDMKFSEDTDFLLRALRTDLQVYKLPFVGYFYSQDTSGITKDISGDQRLRSLKFPKALVTYAVRKEDLAAAQCYYWRNAYYILSQSTLSSANEEKVWCILKKYRKAVILSSSSPHKYRIVALSTFVGKKAFTHLMSKIVSNKRNAS